MHDLYPDFNASESRETAHRFARFLDPCIATMANSSFASCVGSFLCYVVGDYFLSPIQDVRTFDIVFNIPGSLIRVECRQRIL